jgi:CheY-like chemotaxis protein
MANVESVSKCQILEVIRQLASLRYRRAFKKNRDDWDVAPERRRYLDANEVMNVFQASIVLLVACVKPVGANNREQHFALGDCLVERLDEIDAQRDSVDVHEQEFAAELLFQSVVHSSRVTRAAVPAVADEHFGGHRGSSFGDLMDRGAFVPDLDCIPIVNVAYDPTRFEHDPGRGSRRVERVALRDLHPIDKDKKFLAVVVKRLSSPPHICTKSQEKTPHMRCGEVRFQSVSVAAGPESSSASRREAFSPTTGAVMVRVEMDVRPALSVATQLVMVSVAAWSLRQHVQTAASAIVPVPSQGQEAPMRKAIKYLLATAGIFVMVHSAMTVGARAQNLLTLHRVSDMAVILVVEDEEQIRVLVESILVDDGHQTLSAAATAQALAVIQTDRPIDLLFTDIRLGPDVGAGLVHAGLELAQQAVELRPELRVLYTTGYGITDGMKAMFVPGSEFLPKPYDINRLAAKIAALTSR